MEEFVSASAGSDIVGRARALLGEGSRGAVQRTQGEVQKDLAQAREDRAVLAEAVSMQRTAVENLRYKLSAQLCEQGLKAAHREIVTKVAEAARVLEEASAAEQAFRAELDERGIAWAAGGLHPMLFPRIGKLADHNSTVSRYLRECEELGYL
jgi:hypothetical protein